MPKPEWYKEWFDSKYYHILYKHRDDSEAEGFISRLLERLRPPSGARVMDLACGRGRYSRFLAEQGYEVVGLDLSESSIRYARQYERGNLSFFTHDMRHTFRSGYFDYIFNFFTSFGYFEQETDELKTLRSVADGLRPNGTFVLDFFNSYHVRQQPMKQEEKTLEGITFRIQKQLLDQYVTKTVHFEADGQSWYFKEKVRLLELEDFQRLFQKANLNIVQTFGDYALSPFRPAHSPRLILIAQLTG